MRTNAVPVESAVFMNARDVTDEMLKGFNMGDDWTMIDMPHKDKPVVDLNVMHCRPQLRVGTITIIGTAEIAAYRDRMQALFGERK